MYYRRTNAILLGQPVNLASPLNRGLVAWCLAITQGPYFGGARFLDLCVKNHGALTNGPAWGGPMGRPGGFGSLSFDGSNDVVVTSATITIGSEGTVMMWARRTGDGPGQEIFLSATNDSGNTRLRLDAEAGDFRYAFGDTNSTDTLSNFVANQWHHVAMTWSGGGSILRVFFDGTRVVNTSTTSGFPTSNNSLYFGDYVAAGHAFAGQLDDIRFHNVAMADDLIYLYAKQESRQGYPQTLNRVRPYPAFNVAAVGGNRRRRVICGAAA